MDPDRASESEEEQFEDALENMNSEKSETQLESDTKEDTETPQMKHSIHVSNNSGIDKAFESSPQGDGVCDTKTNNVSDESSTIANTNTDHKVLSDQTSLTNKTISDISPDNNERNILLHQDDSSMSGDESEASSNEQNLDSRTIGNDDPHQKCTDSSLENEPDPVNEALKETEEDEVKDGDIIIDEEAIRQQEALLTEEEREARRKTAQEHKEEGNSEFKSGNYESAIDKFTAAIVACPMCYAKDRSIMYSNRGACKYRMEKYEACIEDSTKALELNPHYLKALLRRAECYEKTEKLDEALEDYTKALEMDPSLLRVREACMRLPEEIKQRNEKMKEEMLGKLKDLGNMVLRPFGLSTNNFQLNQDPTTGGYSVNFTQNPNNGNK